MIRPTLKGRRNIVNAQDGKQQSYRARAVMAGRWVDSMLFMFLSLCLCVFVSLCVCVFVCLCVPTSTELQGEGSYGWSVGG